MPTGEPGGPSRPPVHSERPRRSARTSEPVGHGRCVWLAAHICACLCMGPSSPHSGLSVRLPVPVRPHQVAHPRAGDVGAHDPKALGSQGERQVCQTQVHGSWLPGGHCPLAPNGRSPRRGLRPRGPEPREESHSHPLVQGQPRRLCPSAGPAAVTGPLGRHCRWLKKQGLRAWASPRPLHPGEHSGCWALTVPHPLFAPDQERRLQTPGCPSQEPAWAQLPGPHPPAVGEGHSPHGAAAQARRAGVPRPGPHGGVPGGRGRSERLSLRSLRAACGFNNQLVFLQHAITSWLPRRPLHPGPKVLPWALWRLKRWLPARHLPPPGDPCRAQPLTAGLQALRGGGGWSPCG